MPAEALSNSTRWPRPLRDHRGAGPLDTSHLNFQGPPERTQHRCTRDVRDVLPGPGTAGHGRSTQEGEGTRGRPFHNLWSRELAPAEPRAGSPSLLLDRGGPVAGAQLEQLLHSLLRQAHLPGTPFGSAAATAAAKPKTVSKGEATSIP